MSYLPELTRLAQELIRLAQAITEMPGKLAEARTLLANRRAELESASAFLEDREADTLSLVSAETVGPKQAFSNKEAREAEVRKRLGQDPVYLGLREDEVQAQRRKSEAEIELARLQDVDKMLDRQLEAVAAALRAETVQALRQAIVDLTTVEARLIAREESHG